MKKRTGSRTGDKGNKNKRKGISTLVATVLLIVIVVSAGGIIFSWVSRMAVDSSQRASRNTERVMGCSGASIEIKDVYLQNSSAMGRVVVENMGYTDGLVIEEAQMYDNMGKNYTASNIPMAFNRGELAIILFSTQITGCANFSRVSVLTKCADIGDEFSERPICV